MTELERCLDSQRDAKDEELDKAHSELQAKDEQIKNLERKALRERVKMQTEVEELRAKEISCMKEISESQNMCQILEDKIESLKVKENENLRKISEEE